MKKFLAIAAVMAFLVSATPAVWAGEGCDHGCKDKAAAKEKDKGSTPSAGAAKETEKKG